MPTRYGTFEVTLKDVEILRENTTRKMELKSLESAKSITVTQLHYTAWPDHGVPRSTKTFLHLIKLANEENDLKG